MKNERCPPAAGSDATRQLPDPPCRRRGNEEAPAQECSHHGNAREVFGRRDVWNVDARSGRAKKKFGHPRKSKWLRCVDDLRAVRLAIRGALRRASSNV
jgi:hypothetical protein